MGVPFPRLEVDPSKWSLAVTAEFRIYEAFALSKAQDYCAACYDEDVDEPCLWYRTEEGDRVRHPGSPSELHEFYPHMMHPDVVKDRVIRESLELQSHWDQILRFTWADTR